MSRQPLNIVLVGNSLPPFEPPQPPEPALYVGIAEGFPMGPFALFSAWVPGEDVVRDLTAAQVEHLAKQRGLRVVAVPPPV